MTPLATQDDQKRAAARLAVEEIEDGMLVGLGSGSTATFAIEALALRVKAGLRIEAVPTSQATEALARGLGIAITDFHRRHRIDITIDGADQVARGSLDLIKGLGGALLREKIVACASERMVVIIDETKLVQHLGGRTKLPVEIASFGWETVLGRLAAAGAEPTLRWAGRRPFMTDSGNCIADCSVADIPDPGALEARLAAIIGVVESGLFVGMAARTIVGRPTGVEVIDAARSPVPRHGS
jgi:ribose 5-phosphate isomerase A